jgi:hypothetical protein
MSENLKKKADLYTRLWSAEGHVALDEGNGFTGCGKIRDGTGKTYLRG